MFDLRPTCSGLSRSIWRPSIGGGFTVALDFSAGRINFIVNRGAEEKVEGSRLNAATSKLDMPTTVFELKHVSNWGGYENFGIVSLSPCWAHSAAIAL